MGLCIQLKKADLYNIVKWMNESSFQYWYDVSLWCAYVNVYIAIVSWNQDHVFFNDAINGRSNYRM
jgi:hypothetical protein